MSKRRSASGLLTVSLDLIDDDLVVRDSPLINYGFASHTDASVYSVGHGTVDNEAVMSRVFYLLDMYFKVDDDDDDPDVVHK